MLNIISINLSHFFYRWQHTLHPSNFALPRLYLLYGSLSCEWEKIDDNNRFIVKFYVFTLRTTHQPFVYFPFLNFLSSSRVEAIISTVSFIQSYFHNRYRVISP